MKAEKTANRVKSQTEECAAVFDAWVSLSTCLSWSGADNKLTDMFSIDAELRALLGKLHAEKIPYALCGALALAVYGYPRATLDIDLLALKGSAELIRRAARSLGFTLEAAPMHFAQGKVRIERLSKVTIGTEDVLMLDVLALMPEVEREIVVEAMEWQGMPLHIPSRSSLARLKMLRGSPQDLVDVEKLIA